MFVSLRSDQESTYRTADDVWTVDLGYPGGRGKFKLIQIEEWRWREVHEYI